MMIVGNIGPALRSLRCGASSADRGLDTLSGFLCLVFVDFPSGSRACGARKRSKAKKREREREKYARVFQGKGEGKEEWLDEMR